MTQEMKEGRKHTQLQLFECISKGRWLFRWSLDLVTWGSGEQKEMGDFRGGGMMGVRSME